MYLWKGLDEVHGHIGQHPRGHQQRLEEAGGMQRLHLVLLACRAGTDVLADMVAIVLKVEVSVEAL